MVGCCGLWVFCNSVPERASWCTEWTRGTVEGLLVYATRFQRLSVQKTGAFGTEEIFGTKNPLLRYGIDTHFRRALHRKQPPRLSEKSASQSAIGLLGHSGRGRTNRRGTFRTGSPTGTKKKPRLNVTSIGTSEKRQLPTLPPGGAVPSALVSLTSLFGMGRGGSSPL